MTRFEFWFLTLLMVSLWSLMPATQLWDWDEAHYARTGIEMWESGNLTLPQFNGELYGHKPPFAFWVMGLSVHVFGETEFAVRFFSAPALAIAAFLTGRTGALMFDRKTGDGAMVIFATCFLSIYLGAAAMLDAYLLLGCAISVWALVKILDQKRVSFALWLVFAFGGLLTLLVKGPVGPTLIGALVLGVWIFLPRADRPSWRGFWALVAGGILALIVFMTWFLAANSQSGGDFAEEVIGVHIIGRALAPMEGHGGRGFVGFMLFLPVYIPVVLLGMLPWTAYLPASLASIFRHLEYKNRVILLLWILPIFIAFSIVATKLPHYIFPVLAPLSISISAQLTLIPESRATFGRALAVALYLASAIMLISVRLVLGSELNTLLLIATSSALVLLALLVWRMTVTHRSIPTLAVASIAAMQIFYWCGLREIESHLKLSRQLGNAVQAYVPDNSPLFMGFYDEPSLTFYSSRPVDNPILPLTPTSFTTQLATIYNGFGIFTDTEKSAFEAEFRNRTTTIRSAAAARNFNQDGVLQYVYLLEWSSATE